MNLTQIIEVVNALSVVALVAVTIWYARSTALMRTEMRRQAEIIAISSEMNARATLAHLMMEEGTSKRRVEELAEELARLRTAG